MEAARELTPRVGVSAACRAMALPRATYYRRLVVEAAAAESDDGSNPPEASGADENVVGKADPRPPRRSPRALKEPEEQKVLAVLHSERFVDRSPGQVYATLLDEGSYLCSERTMYRILEKHQEVKERRNQRKHPTYTKPELLATGPNEVWSWDITRLRGPVKWTYFYLYVILGQGSGFHFTLCRGKKFCYPLEMPRSPRINFPDAVYHVTSRGNGRARIFLDDDDRHRFVRQLQDNVRTHRVTL